MPGIVSPSLTCTHSASSGSTGTPGPSSQLNTAAEGLLGEGMTKGVWNVPSAGIVSPSWTCTHSASSGSTGTPGPSSQLNTAAEGLLGEGMTKGVWNVA